jgi:insertion element IS1 protein InsB
VGFATHEDTPPFSYFHTFWLYLYTDFWSSYAEIFPASRHRAVGKETGSTNKIERFNNTMRQRISRLVRKTLSFSKKLVNHVGAIWLFVHHYNTSLGM